MLEAFIGGALKGLGAFLCGLLLVAVVRLFSRSAAEGLEHALHLPSMGKPQGETPSVAVPVAPKTAATSAPLPQTQDDAAEAARNMLEYIKHADDIRVLPVAIDTESDEPRSNDDLLTDNDLSSNGRTLKK